jgi:hypothetical protein
MSGFTSAAFGNTTAASGFISAAFGWLGANTPVAIHIAANIPKK